MSKTVFTHFQAEGYRSRILDTLVFESDETRGTDLVAFILERTIDYIAAKESGYAYECSSYGFEDVANMLDNDPEFVELLNSYGIVYLGHADDDVDVSVPPCSDSLFTEEDVAEFREVFYTENI